MREAIFLVGFMGSGKSTLGKELADKLGWRFYDLDEQIEKEKGQSISELFTHFGETHFREIESASLRHFEEEKEPFVLATGGGTPCFHGNMHWMKEQGKVVFLDIPLTVLLARLKGSEAVRPLLKNIDPHHLTRELALLLEKRRPIYLESAWIVGPNEANADEVIHMLNS